VDDFLHLINVLFFIFGLQVIARLPEVHLQGLVAKSKLVRLVEHLDALLCLLHVLEVDKALLVVHKSFSVHSLGVVLNQHRLDLTCFAHDLGKLMLGDFFRDKVHKDVGHEGLSHLLSDGCIFFVTLIL